MIRREASKAEIRDSLLDAAALIESYGRADSEAIEYIIDHGDPHGIATMLAMLITTIPESWKGRPADWLRGVASLVG